MHRWLEIPGDALISRILTCIFVIGVQAGIYILALLVVRHYVKPTSTGNRAIGVLTGAVLGILAAAAYSSTYERAFSAEPEKVSILLLLAVLANISISDFIFSAPKE